MPNAYFQFKQFTVHQDHCAMKVTTDSCLFGAWIAGRIKSLSGDHQDLLDVGTGTGLLSLMVAQQTILSIDAAEIDEDACNQATQNIAASPWKNRINCFQTDIRTFPFAKKYDIIISNPPFYENELATGSLQKNKARHSATLSLRDLLGIISDQLAEGGIFFLLLPYKRYDEINSLLPGYSLGVTEKLFVRQTINHGYFRVILSGKKSTVTIAATESEIAIRNDQQQYTEEFIQLLREYYLHL